MRVPEGRGSDAGSVHASGEAVLPVVVVAETLTVMVGHGVSSVVWIDVTKQLLGAPGLRHGLGKLCAAAVAS